MNKRKVTLMGAAVVLAAALWTVVLSPLGVARVDKDTRLKASLRKSDITDLVFVGVNNWSYVMRNNGSYFYDSPDADRNGNNAGGEFPRGSGTTIVFAAGVYIGTIKSGNKVVSETEFATEFQPGRITNSGVAFESLVADDPASADNRVYVIGRRISDGDNDVWPSEGIFFEGEVAVIADAQTWVVFNDLDTHLSQEGESESPTPGLGMEVIIESYAFAAGPLADVAFLRFIIENKTNTNYPDSYLGLWMDPDVDNASNDIVGVDTARGLGFCYNASNSDQPYCTGFDFFQGPVVNTADISATLAAKFAGNTTTLVWDDLEGRYVPTTLPAGEIWLGATSFNTYANGTDPVDNGERYNLLAGLFANGTPKNGPGVSDYYAFRGNPITGLPAADVATTANQADQRILHGVGPFTIGAGDAQTIWAGVVGAGGSDRINAVANMFTTDDVAQITFDAGLIAPVPPDVPLISVTAQAGQVTITWKNNAEYSEDIVGEIQGISTAGNFTADYRKYDFEGYRVWKSRTGLSGSFTQLAEYDINNGFSIVSNTFVNSNGHIEKGDVVVGSNSGLRYSYVDTDVIIGQAYYYGVTAYDAQPYIARTDIQLTDPDLGTINAPSGLPISLETSPADNVVRVVPMPALSGQNFDASVGTAAHTGPSDGEVTIEIVDPTKVQGVNYTLQHFDIPTDCTGAPLRGTSFLPTSLVGYRVLAGSSILTLDSRADDPRTYYDVNSNNEFDAGDVALDDSKFGYAQASTSDEATEEPVVVHGMKITVFGPALDAKFFQVIATGGGALANPDMGAFAFNASGFPTIDGQAAGGPYTIVTADDGLNDRPNVPNLLTAPASASVTNGGKWGIHTGEVGGGFDYDFFKSRVFRGTNFSRFIPYDWELRFTAAGGFGAQAFTTGTFSPVPFELWRTGIATPNDTTDDYRVIPWILDIEGDDGFNLAASDNTISGGTNDPETDWIYWRAPRDFSTRTAGYDAFIAAGEPFYDYGDPEVMARMVLVNFNGGDVTNVAWPANANQVMPATGTIFRVISTKPNSASDSWAWTGTARVTTPSKSLQKAALKNVKVVPNPYYGRSTYQTSIFDKQIKFTNLPGNCTIRIFTVAGDLVATLGHNSTSNNDRANTNPLSQTAVASAAETSVESWDVRNPDGKFVASGMYVAVVDAPGIGKKTVKFAVIQETITINGPDVR